jgi:hypothetical protein
VASARIERLLWWATMRRSFLRERDLRERRQGEGGERETGEARVHRRLLVVGAPSIGAS